MWRVSHIVPIPKSTNKTEPCNYRPISPLPILSKILERHIHTLISEYLMNECKLSYSQWGFQARKSTTTALIATTHDWHKYLDEGAEVSAIFLDLKKAFDSVPHR